MDTTELLKEYPPLLDVKDAQNILRLGRAATYRLMNDPSFGAIKIGGALRISKSKQSKYLEKA
ncbi:helix-turn-helix domain-containing protein [Paenibacillus sp. GCM10027628]|uniref:helix-turn-helix domain-containing protein n=1 Tax=Paenibacillus sp. GCM10027628 TaxID=3273413 RepID=UPI00363E983C